MGWRKELQYYFSRPTINGRTADESQNRVCSDLENRKIVECRHIPLRAASLQKEVFLNLLSLRIQFKWYSRTLPIFPIHFSIFAFQDIHFEHVIISVLVPSHAALPPSFNTNQPLSLAQSVLRAPALPKSPPPFFFFFFFFPIIGCYREMRRNNLDPSQLDSTTCIERMERQASDNVIVLLYAISDKAK